MLIVLSPAKSLDFESKPVTKKHSMPQLLSESKQLVGVLAGKSPDDLAKLMSLSSSLAELNFERYQEWTPKFTPENSRPAVLAFTGDVYQGMEPGTFSERDFTEAQKSIRILSGLYGVLRPLDLIQPYRLEMGTDLKNKRGKNLYQFWGDRITEQLNEDLSARKSKVLVNLASNEYFSSVNTALLDVPVVAPRFLDEKNGNYKIISFFAKRARGSMAGWLVRNRVKSIKGINDFDGMGYTYDSERSSPQQPTFIRGPQ